MASVSNEVALAQVKSEIVDLKKRVQELEDGRLSKLAKGGIAAAGVVVGCGVGWFVYQLSSGVDTFNQNTEGPVAEAQKLMVGFPAVVSKAHDFADQALQLAEDIKGKLTTAGDNVVVAGDKVVVSAVAIGALVVFGHILKILKRR